MMPRFLIRAALILSLGFAGALFMFSHRGNAQAPQCHQVVSILAEAKAQNFPVTLIADEALSKAKRFYAASPPEGPEPEADAALLIEFPQGGILIFVRGDVACDYAIAGDRKQFEALRSLLLGNPA